VGTKTGTAECLPGDGPRLGDAGGRPVRSAAHPREPVTPVPAKPPAPCPISVQNLRPPVKRGAGGPARCGVAPPPVLARIQAVVGEGPVQLGCRGGVGRVSLRHLCGMTRHVWRLNSRPVSSLGCRSTSSERPRLGRRAPAPVASGVSAIARCTECGPARWWCNSTAPRREDAASWRLCRAGPWRGAAWLSVP